MFCLDWLRPWSPRCCRPSWSYGTAHGSTARFWHGEEKSSKIFINVRNQQGLCIVLFTTSLHCFSQTAAAGAPMMPQSMMGQPMMRPPFTGPAAPGAPVNNLILLFLILIWNHLSLTVHYFLLSCLQGQLFRAPKSLLPRTLLQISTSRISYNPSGMVRQY